MRPFERGHPRRFGITGGKTYLYGPRDRLGHGVRTTGWQYDRSIASRPIVLAVRADASHRGPCPLIDEVCLMIAGDFFRTDLEFKQLCLDAISLARNESAEEFTADMMKKARQHGLQTYLSEKQLNWLCQIADHERPMRLQK